MLHFDQETFINEYITGRSESLFAKDISDHYQTLSENISGKSVLVIGGAGTIGSSFIKSILEFKPSRLFVIDINENGLTELTRDIRSNLNQYIPSIYKTYPINFGDDLFRKLFRSEGPFDIVANFAAHKHVRSEKDPYSIQALLKNNLFNAKSLLDLLSEHKPQHFFCVSTDKAANPVNIMGASKKLMENLILSYADSFKISTARFANVAFSNGSLLHGFLYRIAKSQPISCPSDVKRYFVSPKESGQICMLACILGQTGDIFFPKLRSENLIHFSTILDAFIKDLGLNMVVCSSEYEAKKLAQSRSKMDPYPVYLFKSDTSGEKLFEEFFTKDDPVNSDHYESLSVIKNSMSTNKSKVFKMISDLKKNLEEINNKEEIIQLLKKYIPSFNHIEKGKNLDERM